jgi:hypothetical protein
MTTTTRLPIQKCLDNERLRTTISLPHLRTIVGVVVVQGVTILLLLLLLLLRLFAEGVVGAT